MTKDISKIMMWHVEMVTILRRNVPVVCGTSYHLLGYQISQDSKIRFWLQVKSYISDWLFSKSRLLASYVSRHKAMAYDTNPMTKATMIRRMILLFWISVSVQLQMSLQMQHSQLELISWSLRTFGLLTQAPQVMSLSIQKVVESTVRQMFGHVDLQGKPFNLTMRWISQ